MRALYVVVDSFRPFSRPVTPVTSLRICSRDPQSFDQLLPTIIHHPSPIILTPKSNHPNTQVPRHRIPPTSNPTRLPTTRPLTNTTQPTTSREHWRKIPLRTIPALPTRSYRRGQTPALTSPYRSRAERWTHGWKLEARGHGFPARGVGVAGYPAAYAFVVAYCWHWWLWWLRLRETRAAGCAC